MAEVHITSAGADALIEESVSNDIAQGATGESVLLSMGRQLQDIPAQKHRIPVLDLLPTAYFVSGEPSTETSFKKTTKMQWAKKYLTAEEVACIIPIHEDILDDSSYPIWTEVQPRISEAIGIVIDNAGLFGVNKPASWPTDIVAGAAAAGNSVVLGSGVDMYDDLLSETGVIAKIEADGYMPTGHVAAVGMRGRYRGLRDADGQPIFGRVSGVQGPSQYQLDGDPIAFPKNGIFVGQNALQITGDWSQAVWAWRRQMTFKVLTEAVIQDPSTGDIIYNLAQQDMVALRVTVRLGWQLPNPINREQEVEANRYPFATLLAS